MAFPTVVVARPIVDRVDASNTYYANRSTNAAQSLGNPLSGNRYVTLEQNPYLRGYLEHVREQEHYQVQLASYVVRVQEAKTRKAEQLRRDREREEERRNRDYFRYEVTRARSSNKQIVRSRPEEEKPTNVITKSGQSEEGRFILRRRPSSHTASNVTSESEAETAESETEAPAKPSLWTHLKRALIGH